MSMEESWAKTRRHLSEARRQLLERAKLGRSAWVPYEEWMAHNELELALDELEALATEHEVEGDFWSALLEAARNMNLQEHAERYLKKSRTPR